MFDWLVREGVTEITGVDGGRLLCDDGTGEAADFVHLHKPTTGPRELTLFHLKGAQKSEAYRTAEKAFDKDKQREVRARRAVAVVGFELVGAQAVKSLSNLGLARLLSALEANPTGVHSNIERLMWVNGHLKSGATPRKHFTKALRQTLDADSIRRVVLVHPQIRRRLYDDVRKGKGSNADAYWLNQIDTFLHSVAQACRNFGAELVVIGDDDRS